jgi:hypothetical protein
VPRRGPTESIADTRDTDLPSDAGGPPHLQCRRSGIYAGADLRQEEGCIDGQRNPERATPLWHAISSPGSPGQPWRFEPYSRIAGFTEMIERLFPDVSKLELFARVTRPGWTAWGNEVGTEAGSLAEKPQPARE